MRCTINDKDRVSRVLTDKRIRFQIDGYENVQPIRWVEHTLNCKEVYVLSPDINSVHIFMPYSEYTYWGHSAILPEGRGKVGIENGHKTIRWMMENTKCISILGMTPSTNRAAIRFNLLLGFKKYGVVPKAHIHNGEVTDMILFGINK